MRCLKCGKLIDNNVICQYCLTNQEEYSFNNINNLSFKQILSFIFQLDLIDDDLSTIKGAFHDLLFNYQTKKNILDLVLDEKLLSRIRKITTNEEGRRIVITEATKISKSYLLSKSEVHNLLADLVEAIRPDFSIYKVRDNENRDNTNNLSIESTNFIDENKRFSFILFKKRFIKISLVLIIIVGAVFLLDLRTNSTLLPIQVGTDIFNEEFMIVYYDSDSDNRVEYPISTMDSFYNDGTWYV